ncbi:hypothetical protein SMG44B_20172 [Stenotrophomonas maltophilia]|nr:hypothetical protein BN126310315 [Stenotrophomonas maltophilia]
MKGKRKIYSFETKDVALQYFV